MSQCSDDSWRHKMNDEILREAMFYDGVSVEIRSAHDDNKKQIEDIRHFIDKKVDLLIVAPNEAAPITPVVEEAFDKGIPVIIMSAKVDVDNKVALLLGGAVDYMTKPFYTRELLARIAVHLRTFDSFAKSEILTFEEIKLNIDTHIAQIKDVEIKLTRTEYAILKLLMQNQTQVVSKSHLLDHISEDTPDCTESSLKTHISNLRKKLRAVNGKEYIEAVWGIGFKMKEE